MTCNWMGGTHCNREIRTVEDLGKRGSAHINRGDQPHEWRSLAQCRECYEKDCETAEQAIGQMDWRVRRQARDYSQGETARALHLGVAEYSRLESLRAVAPAQVVADFDAIFPKVDSETN